MNVKEKIIRIMELALTISPPETDDIGKKRTAVFVRWSPHVNVLDADIHYGGWKADIDPDERYYITVSYKEEECLLDALIRRLEKIAKEECENADEG